MIYELAHIVKDKFTFLWDLLEKGNSIVFFWLYHKKLKNLDKWANEGIGFPYEMRDIAVSDIPKLSAFFGKQPQEAFRFFKPHKFDEKSLERVVRNKSFLTFVLTKHVPTGREIVGYAFMRTFVNGASYRGYMIDASHRGKGLAKMMGNGMNRVGDALGLKMYKSISPDNIASMKVTQAVCDIEILKALNNGDYLLRCMSKRDVNKTLRGGVKCNLFPIINKAVAPQTGMGYAA